ncbi:hypothetical protein [Paraburkholderia guartelaensis]|uniref:Uncharacterized protein n=1 Tax=Paraburkholderia guartelaensis TaxID=2546446 RepID=A0ABU9SKI9_9BURK
MRTPITEFELRAAWHRLRMVGDFEMSMRNSIDAKRLAANDDD